MGYIALILSAILSLNIWVGLSSPLLSSTGLPSRCQYTPKFDSQMVRPVRRGSSMITKIDIQPIPLITSPDQIKNIFAQYVRKFHPGKFDIPDDGQRSNGIRLLQSDTTRYRQQLFYTNYKTIQNHNSQNRKYRMGLNQFTLYGEEEFTRIYASGIILPKKQPSVPPKINQLLRIRLAQLQAEIMKLEEELSSLTTKLRKEESKTYQQESAAFRIIADSSISKRRLLAQSIPEIKDIPLIIGLDDPVPQLAPDDPRKRQTIDWSCIIPNHYIYNQGMCGSCYAFAALDTLIISHRIKKSQPQFPLSVQQILSCGNNGQTLLGCKGGQLAAVYKYVKNNGVGSGLIYKYEEQAKKEGKMGRCRLDQMPPFYRARKVFLKSYLQVQNDCNALMNILEKQPIAVTISTGKFQFYQDGTFTTTDQLLNHGVALIGYYPGRGYLVRNSWGNTWGNQGYAFVDESTGICKYGIAPVIQ